MMKVVFTEWHGRIAPLFDVAQTALMVQTEAGGLSEEKTVGLPLASPLSKVAFLAEQSVDLLVCGAISRPVREAAEAGGIQVHPFVAGDIREVVDAWKNGRLDETGYSMPGCRRCRHQRRQRSGRTR
jgi:predicted Fe-Mo cluster-binding NifX family protein